MRCPKCHREVKELWEDPYHPESPRVCEDCFDREIVWIEGGLLVLVVMLLGLVLWTVLT